MPLCGVTITYSGPARPFVIFPMIQLYLSRSSDMSRDMRVTHGAMGSGGIKENEKKEENVFLSLKRHGTFMYAWN